MSKTIIIAVVLLLVVGGGGAWFVLGDSNDEDESTANESSQSTQSNGAEEQAAQTADEASPTDNQPETTMITAADVATHASESDCWTIIDNKVYDLTNYIPNHPGKDAILAACGTDGTSLFRERQTAEGEPVGSGTPHSSRAESALPEFEIGDLAQ